MRGRRFRLAKLTKIIQDSASMKTLIKIPISSFLIAIALACIVGLPKAQAVLPSPTPDGGYAGGNTAEGQNALFGLTTGGFNTAVGFLSLTSNTTGSFDTAVGAGALLANTADENTATGTGALLNNTTGTDNTANGGFALFGNTVGNFNTAIGVQALLSNTSGTDNTATGVDALFNNTTGGGDTANGNNALASNSTGVNNTASGFNALAFNTTGGSNVALGYQAGSNATTGSNNVYIGAGISGVAGESNACYIASIFGQTSATGTSVFINSSGQLGTSTSSRRFKEDIKPMDKASDALFALKPVAFRYKKEVDPSGTSQLGLVAEDVEKVNPDLVVRDKEGKPYSVRYDQVNAMLLNEFLKEHSTVQELKKQVAVLTATVKEQASQIQKVSAQLEVSKPAPQTVLNNQ
jgi:hypothetical protein